MVRTYQPLHLPCQRSSTALFSARVAVDPLYELRLGFERVLHFKTQLMGGVPVSLSPAAARGGRFDEVGHGDAKVDAGIADLFEGLLWPRQVVEPKRGDLELVALEGDELVLDDQRDGLVSGVEDPVLGRHTPAITPQHHLLRLQAALTSRPDRGPHGRSPCCAVDQERTDGLWPVVRVGRHRECRDPRSLRGRRTGRVCRVKSERVDVGCGPGRQRRVTWLEQPVAVMEDVATFHDDLRLDRPRRVAEGERRAAVGRELAAVGDHVPPGVARIRWR